jgi:hypothetical protein
MTDANNAIRMKTVANEKTLAGAKPAVKGGKGSVYLDFSWEVAPAQSVAILDLTGEETRDLPPLAARGPVAAARLHRVACNCPTTPIGKI